MEDGSWREKTKVISYGKRCEKKIEENDWKKEVAGGRIGMEFGACGGVV